MKTTVWTISAILLCLAVALQLPAEQKVNKTEQGQALSILRHVEDAITKNYYDPAFHGFDLQGRFKAAEKKLEDAPTLVAGLGVVAWAVQ